MSGPSLMMLLMAIVAASYSATALFLRRVRVEAPETFTRLGSPGFKEIFSRNPSHFTKQFRFVAFVLSGRALCQLPRSLRTLAVFVWLTQVGTLSWFVYFAYLAATGKLPE